MSGTYQNTLTPSSNEYGVHGVPRFLEGVMVSADIADAPGADFLEGRIMCMLCG